MDKDAITGTTIAPDQVRGVFTVEVISRRQYTFEAVDIKTARQMVKNDDYPKDDYEVLADVVQPRTLVLTGYVISD